MKVWFKLTVSGGQPMMGCVNVMLEGDEVPPLGEILTKLPSVEIGGKLFVPLENPYAMVPQPNAQGKMELSLVPMWSQESGAERVHYVSVDAVLAIGKMSEESQMVKAAVAAAAGIVAPGAGADPSKIKQFPGSK